MDEKTARKKVMAIMDDINDRSGIGDELQMIDDQIKLEIIDSWIAILIKE